jgi:hypothetical protein
VTQTINIPSTLFTGHQVTAFPGTNQQYSGALLTIDRTITSGLNGLAATDFFTYVIDYSIDNGANWIMLCGDRLRGGIDIAKGVQHNTDLMSVGYDGPLPIGTQFQVTTDATTPVRIAGSMVYS